MENKRIGQRQEQFIRQIGEIDALVKEAEGMRALFAVEKPLIERPQRFLTPTFVELEAVRAFLYGSRSTNDASKKEQKVEDQKVLIAFKDFAIDLLGLSGFPASEARDSLRRQKKEIDAREKKFATKKEVYQLEWANLESDRRSFRTMALSHVLSLHPDSLPVLLQDPFVDLQIRFAELASRLPENLKISSTIFPSKSKALDTRKNH